MANIKQQKKRIGTDAKRRLRNLSVKTRMKTMVKKADAALAGDDTAGTAAVVNEALSAIDKAASKGVIHPNSAARKKSSLMHRSDKAGVSA